MYLVEPLRGRREVTPNRACMRPWYPSVENRDGWGSVTCGGARVVQPPL